MDERTVCLVAGSGRKDPPCERIPPNPQKSGKIVKNGVWGGLGGYMGVGAVGGMGEGSWVVGVWECGYTDKFFLFYSTRVGVKKWDLWTRVAGGPSGG